MTKYGQIVRDASMPSRLRVRVLPYEGIQIQREDLNGTFHQSQMLVSFEEARLLADALTNALKRHD